MRPALIGLGVLLDLLGTLWVLQGFDVLTGSPMSGSGFWAAAGFVSMLVGAALIVVGVRMKAAPGGAPGRRQ